LTITNVLWLQCTYVSYVVTILLYRCPRHSSVSNRGTTIDHEQLWFAHHLFLEVIPITNCSTNQLLLHQTWLGAHCQIHEICIYQVLSQRFDCTGRAVRIVLYVSGTVDYESYMDFFSIFFFPSLLRSIIIIIIIIHEVLGYFMWLWLRLNTPRKVSLNHKFVYIKKFTIFWFMWIAKQSINILTNIHLC
jgi:hypothetical protein